MGALELRPVQCSDILQNQLAGIPIRNCSGAVHSVIFVAVTREPIVILVAPIKVPRPVALKTFAPSGLVPLDVEPNAIPTLSNERFSPAAESAE